MRALLPSALLVLVMAQPNMATGMMPLYRSQWDLAPILITVIFAAYLFALVPTLSTVGRPTERSGWGWRIAAGVAAAAIADLTMAIAADAAVASVARVAAGISVGLVTGSISGLALERLGERGRTVMATATMLGSAIGTMAAAGFAQYLPAPRVTVYLVHAATLLVVATLLLTGWKAEPAAGARRDDAVPASVESTDRRLTGYLCGVSGWVSAGVVVALIPSYAAQILDTPNLVVLAMPVTVYLLSGWLGQRLVAPTSIVATPVVAQSITVAGVLLAASVSLMPSVIVLLAAGVIAGLGQGMSYRCGLRIVSAATSPGEHSNVASRYAAIAYLAAAVATIGLGAIATVATMTVAVATAATLLAGIVAVVVVTTRSTPTSPTTSSARPSDALV